MKKKLTALALVVVLLAVAVVGGSLAYFTDTDEATNTFTVGNVAITQYEHKLVGDELVALDPNEAMKLMPVIMTTPNNFGHPTADAKWYLGNQYTNLDVKDDISLGERYVTLWDEANVVDKMVSVTNDGDNGVYVRTIVAYPTELGEELALCVNGPGRTWSWDKNVATTTIDGVSYTLNVYTYIRNDGIVETGESTGPSLMQVCMKSTVNNDDIPTAYKNGFHIYVASQAVQADGFAETYGSELGEVVAPQALDLAFGAITADNNPWA